MYKVTIAFRYIGVMVSVLTGAMTLICDMNEYKKVMKEFKVSHSSFM